MDESEQIKIKDYQTHTPPLGEGAFGKVYRATYRGISDRALKIFRPGAVDLSTMARELEKLSKVAEHQGIVTLHDFDLLHDPPYYAMGLHADQTNDGNWETRTLEQLCGHVDHREGWRLLGEIADAAAYLHRNQIIHCDIKPSNILLTDETPYRIKICDFGQSRGLVADGFDPVGTPLYASPEQLRDPRDSSEGKGFRWDVYSFGVVAFKLLTGELPRLQELAETNDSDFDPDATLSEFSMESTIAESGNDVDGQQLAAMTESVKRINWPSGLYIPSARKDLIEQCLSLDPEERPADMREVHSLFLQIDQQDVVKRARRLNTIFATLLVVAIWASGFAFIQAQKARRATEDAVLASEESNKNVAAALDLLDLFVSELNKPDFSTTDAKNRLHSIVAENASTFLESRLRESKDSLSVLRLSGQTAVAKGRDALSKGEVDEALKHFTSAFEIRSQLSAEPGSLDLARLAAGDLNEIGKIHELKEDYESAADAYTKSLAWLTKSNSESEALSLIKVKQFSRIYERLCEVYLKSGETKLALTKLEELLTILDERIANGEERDVPAYSLEKIRALQKIAAALYENLDLTGASETNEKIIEIVESMSDSPPIIEEAARNASIDAIHNLARIQYDLEQLDAALVLFRQEIAHREEVTRIRSYDAEEKILLAHAYFLGSQCFDLSDESSRSNAVFYIESALTILGRLPPEIRHRDDVQDNIIVYNESLSSVLELYE